MTELERTVEALKLCVPERQLAKALEKVDMMHPNAPRRKPGQGGNDALIQELLLDVGVPTGLVGYRYAQTGIRLILEDPQIVEQGITKAIYPAIARIHHSTPSRVERGIRTGIEAAFLRGDPDVQFNYFRNAVKSGTGKPTNKEFLVRIAEMISQGGNSPLKN